MAAIIGRKLGMTQIFAEDGNRVTLTVIEAGPCPARARARRALVSDYNLQARGHQSGDRCAHCRRCR